MSVNNSVISAPIDFSDPYNCMGVAAQSNGYDVGYICANGHGKINMWSRAKPVRFSSVSHTSDTWWKGDAGNCGIDISGARATSYKNIRDIMTSDGKNGYAYIPPTATDWKRIDDFEGYMHDAVPFVSGWTCSDKAASSQAGKIEASLSPSMQTVDQIPGSVSMEDIGGLTIDNEPADLGDFYFGIVVYDSSGNYKQRVTSSTQGVTGEVELTTYGWAEGSYTIYPFLSSAKQSYGATDVAATYYTLPNVASKKVTIVSTLVAISVKATWTLNSIMVKVKVTNNTAGSLTFSNNTVWLKYSGNTPSDTNVSGESSKTLQDFTVASNESSNEFTTTFLNLDSSKTYVIYVTLNGMAYQQGPVSPIIESL